MNPICMTRGHNFEKVYPDQELIDALIFEQEIEEVWECQRCGKTKHDIGTYGKLKDKDR